MSRVRLVTAAGDIDRETLLAEALTYRDDVDLILRCLDRVELLAAILGGGIDAVVLVGVVDWFDHQLATEASHRGITTVSLADQDTDGAALTIHPDAGLDEILSACAAPPAQNSTERPSAAQGRVTAVWGPKGSPGRTRVAIDLAFSLERNGGNTVLLDADPYGGDITQALGIVEELPTVIWASLLASKGELDDEQVVSNLRRAGQGPIVIPGLPRAELWPDVSEFGFVELLSVCKRSFRHTIVDVGFCLEPGSSLYTDGSDGRNRMARETLRNADRVVAVFRADAIGLRNFLWTFGDLADVVALDDVVIAANRVTSGQEKEVARLLQRHLGRRPVAYLPDRPDLIETALEAGSTVWTMKGAGEWKAAIEALAISVGAKLRPRGVLTRLGARA